MSVASCASNGNQLSGFSGELLHKDSTAALYGDPEPDSTGFSFGPIDRHPEKAKVTTSPGTGTRRVSMDLGLIGVKRGL